METRYTAPVETTGGKIRGYYQEDGITVFKGVPYAEPPVGEKRWKPAEKYAYREGVRDCTGFGSSAWQNPLDPMSARIWTEEFQITNRNLSEDCLTLNIWAPEGKKGLPVILYFYGGGYVAGGSSCPIYDGTSFAKKDVIYISFNHREGVFGWYANDELIKESENGTAGNYMMTDAVAALEWIRDNIEKFGGDPENVTLWGQSAGAGEVNMLSISPVAQSLFTKCVSMGLNSYHLKDWLPLEKICRDGNELEKKFGGSLEKMRAAAPGEFLQYFPGSKPAVDGYFTKYDMAAATKKGLGSKKPLIMGFTARDGITDKWYLYKLRPCRSVEELRKVLKELFPESWEEVESTYLKDDDIGKAVNDICHDILIQGALEYLRERTAADPDSETYLYIFNHVMPGPDSAIFGSFHSCEVPYFTEYFSDFRAEYWTEADKKLGERMNGELVSFAKTGKPKSDDFIKSDGTNIYVINTDEQHNEHITEEEYNRLVRLFGKANLWG